MRPAALFRSLGLLAFLGLALLIVGVSPSSATAAHNVLIGSDPVDGASLATAPARVSLTFDLPVQPGFSTVTVTGPDGNQWQAGPPIEDGAVVSAPVRALGPAGEYTIGYQVLSADGHPVRGAVRFTLTAPGSGTPAPPPATGSEEPGATPPSPAAQSGSGGTPVWLWLVGAGVLLAAGLAMALRISRSGD